MNNVVEKLTSANQDSLEAMKTIGTASLQGIGELVMLNLKTASAVTQSGMETLTALSEVRDLPGLKVLQKPVAVAALEQTMAYSRQAYRISNASSTVITQACGSQLRSVGSGLAAVINQGRKSIPMEVAIATTKSLISVTKQVVAQVGKMAASAPAAAALKQLAKSV